jgi:putative peptidoglycan lipid II flippase
MSPTHSKHYIFKHASTIALLTGAGVASGIVLDALILSAFGVSRETDALLTANTLPTLLIGVFSIQSSKILVPVFADLFSRNSGEAWNLLNKLITNALVGLGAFCVLCVMLASVVIRIQIPGLGASTIGLAVSLSRILFGLILYQGLAAILQAALAARHRYAISSSGKLIGNLVTCVFLIVGRSKIGIHAVATGMVAGSLVQIGLLLVALASDGFRYRWTFRPTDSTFLSIVRSLRHPVAGHIVGESGSMLQNFLGSFLGSGSVTVMRYATRIVQALGGILLGSVVQVTLPLVAKHAAANDTRGQRRALLESLQLLAMVGLPISVWLVLTAEPLLMFAFGRGGFTRADAVLCAFIIRLMVPDILLGRIVSVTQTLFYANMDTLTPLVSTIIFVVVHTILAITLVYFFGLPGLPVAVSLASLSNTTYMIWRLRAKFGPFGWWELRSFALRLTATCFTGALGLMLGTKFVGLSVASHSLAHLLDLAVPTTFWVITFAVAVLLFRPIDIWQLVAVKNKS